MSTKTINLLTRKTGPGFAAGVDAGLEVVPKRVLAEIDDGVFLISYKQNGIFRNLKYAAVDARTGKFVGYGITKEDTILRYENNNSLYKKLKSDPNSNYYDSAEVNKKDSKGNWIPIKNPAFVLVNAMEYTKKGKKGKFERTNSIRKSGSNKKFAQRFLNERATSDVELPTIRKIYAKDGEIYKVVDYEKDGATTKRRSYFRKGKFPKGTKLVSKKFIKARD